MSLRSHPTWAALAAALCVSFGLSVSLPASVAAAAQSRGTSVQKSTTKKTSTVRRAKSRRTARSKAAAARRARLARARAAAIREAQLPRYKTDATGTLVPDLHAAAAIIYNPETKQVLWEEHSQDKRSIASITKVMTAVIISETDPDPARMVTIERADVYAASTTHLRANYVVSVDDLMHLLLISSDNAAARALARVSPWGADGFVRRMNEKAVELGLQSTAYADPSGLDAANVSSAYDMARLIAYAAGDEWISEIMRKKEHQLVLGKRARTIHSTNRLLANSELQPNVLGGKTGFINRAGYCLVTLLKLPEVNQPVAVVVLGARSNAGRFTEARNLLGWVSGKAKELLAGKDEKPE
ncbi:MAG TPA: serine hydrolase [Vicinamibacterales bacterium]|nr:serine hydrolase [Vicinamibacterales bacterium]